MPGRQLKDINLMTLTFMDRSIALLRLVTMKVWNVLLLLDCLITLISLVCPSISKVITDQLN